MQRRTVAVFALVVTVLIAALSALPPGHVTTAVAIAPRVATSTTAAPTTTSTSTTTTVPKDAFIPPIENALAPVISRIATAQPVVFLTIDDGGTKDPALLELLRAHGLQASLFLAHGFIRDDPAYFAGFVRAGHPIENHSIRHAAMPRLSYARQVEEICGQADLLAEQYGHRPTLFRPPGGAFNTDTRRAAAACGMRAVVNWIALISRGQMAYQVGRGLRPGDIVLMHFRPEFAADIAAFVNAISVAGLHTELLEDWIR